MEQPGKIANLGNLNLQNAGEFLDLGELVPFQFTFTLTLVSSQLSKVSGSVFGLHKSNASRDDQSLHKMVSLRPCLELNREMRLEVKAFLDVAQ